MKAFKKAKNRMDNIALLLSPIAVLLVFIVLCFGIWNMMKGNNPGTSQKLMRWRVILQFIAVCILMAAIYSST